jgi:hypothetical protein
MRRHNERLEISGHSQPAEKDLHGQEDYGERRRPHYERVVTVGTPRGNRSPEDQKADDHCEPSMRPFSEDLKG